MFRAINADSPIAVLWQTTGDFLKKELLEKRPCEKRLSRQVKRTDTGVQVAQVVQATTKGNPKVVVEAATGMERAASEERFTKRSQLLI